VKTLCNLIEHHAAAFILNTLKTITAAWRLHSVLDSGLCGSCGNAVGLLERRERVLGAPCARCNIIFRARQLFAFY